MVTFLWIFNLKKLDMKIATDFSFVMKKLSTLKIFTDIAQYRMSIIMKMSIQ